MPWSMPVKAREFADCCVCGRLGHGDWFPSGERNRRTGETPCENFICEECQTGSHRVGRVGATFHSARSIARQESGLAA